MKSLVALALCLFTSLAAHATTIAVGTPLPALTITDKGELVAKGDDFSYQPWSSTSLTGRVQIVQYLAARHSTSTLNKPFMDALKAASFPPEKHLSTSVVNVDDALWGTAGLLDSNLKSNKKKDPHTSLVADTRGDGLKLWGLKKESSAIAILDKTGNVIFFKDGALTAAEIKSALALIQNSL